MEKKFFFRVDGGEEVGLGHLMRSISLAKSLKKKNPNVSIYFIGNKTQYILEKLKNEKIPFIGFNNKNSFDEFYSLIIKENPVLIFIDTNYSYNVKELAKINKISKVILFNNLYKGALEVYSTIIPNAHRKKSELDLYKGLPNFYYGLDYVIINKKIVNCDSISSNEMQIAITTGGSDPVNVLLKVLEILKNTRLKHINIVAFYGENYMYKKELFQFIDSYKGNNIKVYPYDFCEILSAKIVISTFGVSTYELMYKGKPLINIGHSLFNTECASILNDKYNCFVDWGYVENLQEEQCVNSLIDMLNSPDKLKYYSEKGQKLIDGKGEERINEIFNEIIKYEC